jgi:hypothetical protein
MRSSGYVAENAALALRPWRVASCLNAKGLTVKDPVTPDVRIGGFGFLAALIRMFKDDIVDKLSGRVPDSPHSPSLRSAGSSDSSRH